MVIIKWINVVVFIALNFYLVMMFLTWVDDKIDGSDSFYDWTKKDFIIGVLIYILSLILYLVL